jgi:hypothetical protein
MNMVSKLKSRLTRLNTKQKRQLEELQATHLQESLDVVSTFLPVGTKLRLSRESHIYKSGVRISSNDIIVVTETAKEDMWGDAVLTIKARKLDKLRRPTGKYIMHIRIEEILRGLWSVVK